MRSSRTVAHLGVLTVETESLTQILDAEKSEESFSEIPQHFQEVAAVLIEWYVPDVVIHTACPSQT